MTPKTREVALSWCQRFAEQFSQRTVPPPSFANNRRETGTTNTIYRVVFVVLFFFFFPSDLFPFF
ncbi:hypothetical protein MOQ_003227, partial [Trypanosoma cruzi marinkellei]